MDGMFAIPSHGWFIIVLTTLDPCENGWMTVHPSPNYIAEDASMAPKCVANGPEAGSCLFCLKPYPHVETPQNNL